MELQATRVKLENELGPLREERAATLQQLSQLREMVKHPEWYEKLKKENAALKEQCGQLQESLQAERGNTQRQKEANKQLTQKLQDSTNPEQLQAVKDCLERYRQERDTSRQQVEELQKQLDQLALTNQQRQSYDMDRHQVSKTNDSTESDTYKKGMPSLKQSDIQRSSVDQLTPANVPGSNYPLSQPLGITNFRSGSQSQSSTSSEQQLPVQVNTKSGTKSMVLCKLTDPKKGMKVIVKRSGPGEYDVGTIRYMGKVEGASEDYAGIELDLPSESNKYGNVSVIIFLSNSCAECPSGRAGDGEFKGKYHFRW